MNFFCKHDDLQLEPDSFVAMVVEVQKNYAFVIRQRDIRQRDMVKNETGYNSNDVWLGTVQGKFSAKKGKEKFVLCVGDIVVCKPKEDISEDHIDLPTCLITNAIERKNLLQKPSKKLIQNVASNIDQVLIVISIDQPKLNFGFLDRYLVLCSQQNIKPLIIFNKSDLLKEMGTQEKAGFDEMLAYYQKISYEVLVVSTKTKKNIRELHKLFHQKISLIVGQSGVGKSSLINLLSPDLIQAVDEFGPILTKGRHVTSFVSMVKIKADSYLIDTPGIKSLALNINDPQQLELCFPEMQPFLGQCKYRNCLHKLENNCAIKNAVTEGELHQNRYESYLKLIEEIEPKY